MSNIIGIRNNNTIIPYTGVRSVGAWTSFTPTGTWTTNTTYTGKYRRVGQDMEVQYKLAFAGAPNATSLLLNLPTGFTIDTSVTLDSSSQSTCLGNGNIRTGAGNLYRLGVRYGSSTTLSLLSARPVTVASAATAFISNEDAVSHVSPHTIANNDVLFVKVIIPVVEWANFDETIDASFYIAPASATEDGIVNRSTQTIIGVKTFGDTTDASSATAGGTVVSGGLAVAKKLYVGTGTYLPSSGATASELNFYAEGASDLTFTANTSGATATNTVSYIRVGKLVTVRLPVMDWDVNNADAVVSSGALPSWACPSNSFFSICLFVKAGSPTNLATPGMVRVDTNGVISIYRDGTASNPLDSTGGYFGLVATNCFSYFA